MLNVNNPSTVYVRFTDKLPHCFKLKDSKGRIYYFRYLNGKTPRIKFNVPDSGIYTSDTSFEIVKIVSIEIPNELPVLPKAERDRYKNTEIILNPNLENTPARIFTDEGIIEIGKKFLTYPLPIQKFLLWHEQGHLFYKSEENCDLFAFVNFIRAGYPRSMGFYTLSNILRRTPENMKRMEALFNKIQKYTGSFDPNI